MSEPISLPLQLPAIRAMTAPALLASFKPIESIVDGLPIARGGLTLLTARTGAGKTTLATLLEIALCRGLPFAGREVTRGSVLVLAGENPDDFTMHLAATLQDVGVTAEQLTTDRGCLLTVPGVFDLDYEFDRLRIEASGADLVAVIVDTSAAFFTADEENDNVAMRRHASKLRDLTRLPGLPAVIVLCHPIKNASQDSLLPRGGGAFIAEADANLTVWKDDSTNVITLHWAGKIRGPSFDPIRFELVPVKIAGRVDCRNKPIWSTVVRHMQDDRAEQLHAKAVDDDDQLLIQLQKKPGASVRDLAMACGWTNGTGKPMHARADRRLRSLSSQGLTEQDRKGKWRLTPKGSKEADRLP